MVIHLQADDAGIGKQATAMILEAWELKMLNGFGVVANPDCATQISAAFTKNKNLDCVFCAHLNITDGMAMGGYVEKSILVAPNGRLQIGFLQALMILLIGGKRKKQFLSEVYQEWDAQLTFISQISPERKVIVINGHNYVHMLPSLFKIAIQLGEKHQIPHIRFVNESFFLSGVKEILSISFYVNLCKLFVLSLCKMKIRRMKILFSALSEETFGVLYSGKVSADVVKKVIKKAMIRGVSSMEIVFHPGLSSHEEMEKWTTLAGSKKFFTHINRKMEWEGLKQLQSENVFANKD